MAKPSQYPRSHGRRSSVKGFAKPTKMKHVGKLAHSAGLNEIFEPRTVLATNPQRARKHLSAKYVQELKALGHDKRTAELLSRWMNDTCQLMVREELAAHLALPAKADTGSQQRILLRDTQQRLSAQHMANALNLGSDESVRHREAAGELFSILAVGRKRGRAYPAFQSWPGIVGEPLKRVLGALKPRDGAAAYTFFTSITDLLALLTPIECMLGELTSERNVSDAALELIHRSADSRLQIVIKAAKTNSAIDQA